MNAKTARKGSSVFALEGLEGRQLLAVAAATPWGPAAKLIGQDLAVANYPQLTGAGEAVAIIDSGVDYKHPVLGGGIGSAYKVEAGYDFVANDADPMSDTFGHGTASAGVVAASAYVRNGLRYQGIAPGVRIIALREDGTGGVKAALDWVYANRAKYNIVAVNMVDFGGGSALIYKDVLKKLIVAGVFVSHPSGNLGPTQLVEPALDPADFAVGSVDLSGKMSAFTQRGAELDLLAPGERVTVPYYDVATHQHIYLDSSDGTSWASPAAVATAALIKQIYSGFTPAQIMKIMQDSGASVYDSVTKLTYRRLNVNEAIKLAYQRRPASTPQPPLSTGPSIVPSAVAAVGASTIQAENFDAGGEGKTWHDTDSANIGLSAYRKDGGVDIQDGSGGSHYVSFVRAGEWFQYTLNLASAGVYNFGARVSSLRSGGTFHVEIDGVDRTGELAVPSTGSWLTWTSVGKNAIPLSSGQHVMRIKMDSAGRIGYVGNFDSFTLSANRSALATTQANTANQVSGISTSVSDIGSLDTGDWALYSGLDFGSTGAGSFTASVASNKAGGQIQIRLGSLTGTIIGAVAIPVTGGTAIYKAVTVKITRVTGVQNIYLTITGGSSVGYLASFRFGA
jgi:hypothetical protein